MRYIVFLFVLSFSVSSWSQMIPFIEKGVVENSDLGKREGGVKVSFVQNGSTLFSSTTASNGKYTIRGTFDYSKPYTIVFSKSGLVSKKVLFDFSKMNEEDIPAGDFRPVESLDMTLFKERENVDFSFLNSEPVAKFDWNTRKMAPRLDAVGMTNMKNRILKLLAEADKNKAMAEINYQKAITAADKLYGEKNYESALAKYEEALGYKPTEQYPADKIVELDALLQAQQAAELADKQENEEYYNLIEAADNLRDQDNLEGALSKYQEALTKKTEQYPKDQIAAINKTIADRKKEIENQTKYDAAIKAGDGFLKQNSLRAAKDKYTLASELKPSEQYPKDKLQEIADKLGAQEEQEALKKKYTDAVAAGDALFTSEDFEGAKAKYEEALTFESAATYPKERIKLCNQSIEDAAAAKQKAEQIAQLIEEGNGAITNKEWEVAKTKFTEVLGLESSNEVAMSKLAIIEAELEKLNNLALQEEKYNQLIKDGNNDFSSDKLEDALAKYTEAKSIKATPEVQTKIDETKNKIKELKELADLAAANKLKQEAYDAAIAEADNAFSNSNWEAAKQKYTAAIAIDDTQNYPTEQIAKIADEIAKEQANAKQEAEALAKKEAYDSAISAADHAFDLANWDEASAKYREAMSFDASQNYPTERLTLIEEKIAEEKEKAEQEAEELAKKAKEEATALALMEKYNSVIVLADNAFNSSNWEEATSKYQEAMSIDATQSYPSEQITLIKAKIEEQERLEKEAAEAKEKLEQYNALVADAEGLFNSSKYSEAISKYREALLIDNSQSYPVEQIAIIEELISKQQSEAEKLAAEAKKKAEITALLTEGQSLFSQDKLENSKSKFEEVLILESSNSVATAKIQEINARLLVQQQELDKDQAFNDLKDEGYRLAGVGELVSAKSKLVQAIAIKQDNAVQAKIKEIEGLIQAENATKSVDESYASLLEEANRKEISHDYVTAISKYNEALVIKPGESFPQQKINELKNLLENEKEAKTNEEKYLKSMDRGDDLMTHKDYLGAIQAYNEALSFKPSEQEPVDKAAEAERLEKAKDQDSDKQYEKIITVAQKKINSAEYVRAIELLNRAKGLRPTDDRPQKMLDKIIILKKQEAEFIALMNEGNTLASNKKYQDAITKYEAAGRKKPTAIEPDEKIDEMRRLIASSNSVNQKDVLYTEYMEKGNSQLQSDKYVESLLQFQNALSAKPGDITAQNKINEVQQILDDISNQKNAELDLKNRFDALVKVADGSFSASEYGEARGKYEEALGLMPGNSYVESQVNECIKQQRLATSAQAEKEYQKIIKAADKNFNKEKYEKAIDYYTRAIGFKPADPYPKEKLAEIQGILNPVSVASAELEDLGDPFDSSIMDGSFILAKAEAERKSLKKTKIERKYKVIQNEATAKTVDNMSDHYQTSNDIYMAYERISIDAGENNLNQDEIAAALRKAKLELENEDSQNIQYEKAENIADQSILYQINEESLIDYGEREDVYRENSDLMKKVQTSHMDARSIDIADDYSANIQSDQDLIEIKSKFDDGIVERFEERAEVAENVKVIRKIAQQAHQEREYSNNEGLISDQVELDKIEIAQEEQAKIESIYASDNNEVLKTGLKELAEAHDNELYRETSKYRDNKIAIDDEVKTNSEIVEMENKAHAEKVKYIERMDKKATIQTVAALEGDLQERLNARKGIHDVYANVSENTREEVVKLESNNEDLKEVNKTVTAKESANNIGKKEDLYAAQTKLNKVTDKQKDKPIIGNALGEEYPEGVSQESFTKSDQDGLVTTIITRRVVVIEGHANVYVRTQSLHGITYSKNGKPSLSSTWNKETQGPDLERHF